MKRKIILDIAMTLIMVCLLNTNITGFLLHEILGIGIFFLFAFHKLFNFKWIKAITRKLFKGSTKPRTRLLYLIDVLLLVLATANVLTGILVSTRILTGIAAKDIYFTSQLHHFLAYCLSLVLVIHIGLHWSYLCKAMKIKKDSLTEKLLCGVIAATLFLILLGSNTVKKFFVPQPAPDFHYQAEKESTAPETEAENLEDNQEPQDTTAPEDAPTEPDIPTLQQFLSNLVCTGCGRRCLLTNPVCGKGRNQQEQAIQEYNQTYQLSETYAAEEEYGYDEYRYEGEGYDSENAEGSGRPNRRGPSRH